MIQIDIAPLIRAVQRCLAEIDAAARGGESDISPERLERMAKSVSIQLKAIHDLEQHNAKAKQSDNLKAYLPYEELPPPSPEERKRIIARFETVVRQLAAGTDLPNYSLKAPPE